MFDRLEKIIGKEKLEVLNNIKIMVVGVGGVGGYTIEALARCGIKNFILIDNDIVDITNKNRQIIALDSTLGKKKVLVMKNRILDVNKECNVEVLDVFLNRENTYEIIKKYMPDYVIDCCDTIEAKKEIILSSIKLNINFISSMGTGNKLDPSKLKISDIRKTNYDPLAKIIRKWVKDERIKEKVLVLWSDEEYIKTHDRTPGSTSFVPSSAGLLIASYIFKKIVNM